MITIHKSFNCPFRHGTKIQPHLQVYKDAIFAVAVNPAVRCEIVHA